MTETVAEISHRALNKDPRALEQLIFLRYDWLVAVARHAIPKDLWYLVEAEDVVQDAAIKILKGFAGFRPAGEGALFQWMKRITEHVAIDHLRRLGNESRQHEFSDGQIELLMAHIWSNDPTASVSMQHKELRRAVLIALDNLEPHYRQTIQLLYIDSMSTEEAARHMGKSEAAVRGYRQRACEQLREAIKRLSYYV